jgi:dTDP-4-dehydrorhamnose reductase
MIILSGANRILGKYILPAIRDMYSVCAFDKERGDIGDHDFLERLIIEMKPQIFINCEAFDNIEDAEYKREEAYQLNGFSVGTIAQLCKEHNLLLIHFSSSFVFDGKENKHYSEKDDISPESVFGDSKALGEKLIKESGCRNLVLRIPYLFGKDDMFLSPLIKKMKEGTSITIIKDQKISPLFANDVAHNIVKLIEDKIEGLYHIANEPSVSLKEFLYATAKNYMKFSKNELTIDIVEKNIDEILSPVDWPKYSILNIDKIKQLQSITTRNWQDALSEYLESDHIYI